MATRVYHVSKQGKKSEACPLSDPWTVSEVDESTSALAVLQDFACL